MKKNNLMKVSAVLATALMAASATGLTTSASDMKTSEALKGNRTTRTTSRSTKRAKSGNSKNANDHEESEISINLKGGKAQAGGDIVEVPIIFESGNQCTCYDIVFEYDARFEFVGVDGAKAFCDFEEDGRKFVSVVGYDIAPYQDGTAAATIKLRVPEGAENDDYQVRVSQVTSFSTDYADFEEYKVNNAIFNVTGGVKKKQSDGLRLRSVASFAGDSAVVQLIPQSGNKCAAIDVLIEYDSRLLLEDKDVSGANSHYIFEENGKSYVSLVAYTADVFADGKSVAGMNFHLPADATASDTFEIKIATVTDFGAAEYSFENYETEDAVISIYQSTRPNDKYKEYKFYKKIGANGQVLASEVGLRGDSNSDGKADVRDAAATASHCASGKGVDEMGQFFADVDETGVMNVRDAAKIARYVASGRTSWDKVL